MASSWPRVVMGSAFPCSPPVAGAPWTAASGPFAWGPGLSGTSDQAHGWGLANLARLLSGFPRQGLLDSTFMGLRLLPPVGPEAER